MHKILALAVVILIAPMTRAADSTGSFMSAGSVDVGFEAGFTMLSAGDTDGFPGVDLNAVYGGFTFEAESHSNYTSSVEAIFLYGLSDERVGSVSIQLDASAELAYRGTWATKTPDLNVFWRGSMTFLELEGDSDFGFSTTAAESGLGMTVGVEWRSFTLGFTQHFNDLDEFSRFSVGYRF